MTIALKFQRLDLKSFIKAVRQNSLSAKLLFSWPRISSFIGSSILHLPADVISATSFLYFFTSKRFTT